MESRLERGYIGYGSNCNVRLEPAHSYRLPHKNNIKRIQGETTMKNCWNCIHRREISGSAHISCRHPSIKLEDSPLLEIFEMWAGVGRVKGDASLGSQLNLKLNPHGVKHGWANWPLNFDPIWINNCDGYEEASN